VVVRSSKEDHFPKKKIIKRIFSKEKVLSELQNKRRMSKFRFPSKNEFFSRGWSRWSGFLIQMYFSRIKSTLKNFLKGKVPQKFKEIRRKTLEFNVLFKNEVFPGGWSKW